MKLKYTIFIVITFFISSNSMAEKMIIDDMKNQSGVPDEEFCESGNAKSVSYTHLTLPTILLV